MAPGRWLAVIGLLAGACGAELPVSLVQSPDACDYHHAAEHRFTELASSLLIDLRSGDAVDTVLRYEPAMTAAAALMPEGAAADEVPLVLVSSYKEYLFALNAARRGDAVHARQYAESFVVVVLASAGASAGC